MVMSSKKARLAFSPAGVAISKSLPISEVVTIMKVIAAVEVAVVVHASSATKKAIWLETVPQHHQVVVVEVVREPALNVVRRVTWLENVPTRMLDHLAVP